MNDQVASYASSGVDYGSLDPVKVAAQRAALATAPSLGQHGAQEITASRGESAYVWEESDAYRSLVIEGLGTKNLIADMMRPVTGKTHYDTIAQDTVAMIVNDLVVVGALPMVVNAYFAVGDGAWMNDRERANDLVRGWAAACEAIGATWGGGETPALKGIIEPGTIDLGGSAVGVINPKERLVLGDKLAAGDEIVLIESSGIHANGISFVRALADKHADLLTTELPDGRRFGEAILTPTHLYVELVRRLMEVKLELHYMVNITGHGWRKLMRATADFTYRMALVPEPHPEFVHMQRRAGVDAREMYGNFNMGAGFAVYVAADQAEYVVQTAQKLGFKAWRAGVVEDGPKQVIIEPLDITFAGDSLEVR